MVISWLFNSMKNEIGEDFFLFGSVKEVWDATRETYSKVDNLSDLFAVKSILHDLQPRDLSVTQYFNILTQNLPQLDMFEEHQ